MADKMDVVGEKSVTPPNTELITCTHTLKGHTARVWDAKWNPTGTLLATCSADKTIRIWGQNENNNWICKSVLSGHHQRTIRSVAWSPCGLFLAAGSFDSTTSIWDRTDGEFECIATLEGHNNEVKCVAWSSSGQLLATCSRDKSVWIWEVLDDEGEYECLMVLGTHKQDVKSVAWHPTEEVLASSSYDDTINVYRDDPHDWLCDDTLTGHASTVWDIAFDKTGDRLASCGADKTLKIWTRYRPGNPEGVEMKGAASKWKCTCTLSGYHTKEIYSISWSTDGYILTGDGSNTIHIFAETSTSTLNEGSFELAATKSHGHLDDINGANWSPLGDKTFVTASDDCFAKIWKFSP